MLTACATLVVCGDSITAIWQWAARSPQCKLAAIDTRRDPLTGRHLVPSERTFRRVLGDLDADAIDAATCGFIADTATGHCACRIPPPCWSGGMLKLVEGAAESRSPSYVQMGDPVRVLDRSGQRVERAGIRKTLVRPVLVIERLELAQGVQGVQEMALVPDQRTV
ncbi:hypothetical protein QFZ49_005346 [Streptomyces turgidiscabies]|uniref:Uncharacterized protein n=2 Tax=Streptomyces turgidiscabies TaxID=85558 RepID=A0ABU0RTQ7_9ACTN|nr:hypothetical protein [Streptomyces turgidiscabies]